MNFNKSLLDQTLDFDGSLPRIENDRTRLYTNENQSMHYYNLS